jgi:hypothetical protein
VRARRAGFRCWRRGIGATGAHVEEAPEQEADDANEHVNVELLVGPVVLGSEGQVVRVLQVSEDRLDGGPPCVRIVVGFSEGDEVPRMVRELGRVAIYRESDLEEKTRLSYNPSVLSLGRSFQEVWI